MNIIFLPIASLVSLALAEPPVGDGYPARSSDRRHDHNYHHDHSTDHDRSPSQDYGLPSFATRNAINEYDATDARNSPNSRGQTHRHTPPTARVSFNQRFSSAASRSSANGQNPSNSDGQGYARNARSGVSQEYGLPESRSLSQEYGPPSPSSARSLSTQYGAPARSSGVSVARSSQKPTSNFRSQNSISENYSEPKSQFQSESHSGYTAVLARSNNVGHDHETHNSYPKSSDTQSVSQTYGTPNNALSSSYGAPSRSPSTSYGTPSASNSAHSQDYKSISQSYTASNERDLSETYGAPNARSPSQEYGLPSSRNSLKADAAAPSYTSTSSRSFPSSSYPTARDATPSQQYGVPQQDDQGYKNSRARALGELLNQESANYDFAYQIEDQESGSDFGHSESRQANRAEGSYFVVLPDGTKHTVHYEADERGFRPRISIEPAVGGYDDNAQDLDRSQGPY